MPQPITTMSQQTLNVLADIVARPVLFRDVLPHDAAVFDDERLGILKRPVFGTDGRVGIAVCVERQMEALEKTPVLLRVFVDANAENHYAPIAEFPVELIE